MKLLTYRAGQASGTKFTRGCVWYSVAEEVFPVAGPWLWDVTTCCSPLLPASDADAGGCSFRLLVPPLKL